MPRSAPYLAALIVFSVVTWIFPKWTVDDAYISFRYAHNLAVHGELTWNVGEDPIEGYTGVVLPVLLAGSIEAGVSPLVASKVLGLSSFLAGSLVLFVLLRRLGVAEPARGIMVFLYLGAPFLYTHAFGGLETLLFSTQILACLLALLACLEAPAARSGTREALLLALLLLTSLTRPEGVVLGATCCSVLLFERSRQLRKLPFAFLTRAALLLVLPGLAYFLWRWSYYGQLLPNTFYVKSYTGLLNVDAAKEMLHFSTLYLAFPLLIGVITTIVDPDLIRERIREGRLLPNARSLVLVGAAALGYVVLTNLQYLRSLLLMNYGHRFFVPTFVVALVGIGVLLHLGFSGMQASRGQKPLRDRLLRFAVAILFLTQLGSYAIELRRQLRWTGNYAQLIADEHVPAGHFIRGAVPPDEWLIVYGDAGAVPYLSELKTVDFGFLNDEVLARQDLPLAALVDYFFSFDAGALVLSSFDPDQLRFVPEVDAIAADDRFERYVLVKRYGSDAWGGFSQFVYLRNDLWEGER